MKNIYLLVILFISLFVNAQKIGGTPAKGVIPIKRVETVSKLNSNEANLLPPGGGDPDPIDPSPSTGDSGEVGVTQGQLSVSLTGGANYTIPIAVPPGINGVEPQISLAYNSQSGNGLAGYGWNISGVSVITRIPSTKYHDGNIDAVDFDNLDRFALDGQRLIVKDGMTYGANAAIYETESFSNLKITSYGVSPFGANYGPESFVVEYPDGSKAFYGNSVNSRSQTDWAINYWENPQGVRISYNYIVENNILRIDSVKYGTIGTNTPINQIQFVYSDRTRAEQAYVGGQSFVNNKILKEIHVIGNGTGFRNYYLTHNVTSLGYQRLLSITEKCGDDSLSYNPTVFSYDTTTNSDLFSISSPITLNVSNVDFTNCENVTGDFDGDGKMDFILYPTTGTDSKKKYWLYNNLLGTATNIGFEHNIGAFDEIFPISWLGGSAASGYKLAPMQGWSVVQNNTTTNVTTFGNYSTEGSFTTGSSIFSQGDKTYIFPKFNTQTEDVDYSGLNAIHLKKLTKKYVSGDFDGDGLTDILAVEINTSFYINPSSPLGKTDITNITDPGDGGYYVDYVGNTYLVNLDKRVASNYVSIIGQVNANSVSRLIVADVNGDGKSDLLVLNEGIVKVFTLNEANQLVLLFTKTDGGIFMDKPFLMGDYNGDGKSDFVIPQTDNTDSWRFYLSTGTDFNATTTAIGRPYETAYSGYFGIVGFNINTYSVCESSYVANDFNGDGKTDILSMKNYTVEYVMTEGGPSYTNYGDPQVTKLALMENKSTNGGWVGFTLAQTNAQFGGIRRSALPVFLDHNSFNGNLEYALISGNFLRTFKSTKDNRTDVLLKKITTGNGVSELITYSSLTPPSEYETNFDAFYTDSRGTENYPSIDIVVAPAFRIVSSLEQISQTGYKKKDYKYYGAVSNLEGLGFLGFRSTANTNWYNDDFQIISNVSKFDISKRGALVEDYTLLGIYQPSSNFSPSSYISKSVLAYDDELRTNKVYRISNTSSTVYNGLEGTSKEVTTVFDDYNNPLSNTVYTKQGTNVQKTDITLIDYFNNTETSPYVIGRPTKKNTDSRGINDTNQMTGEEIYEYTNGLLTRVKKKGHNTDYLVEDNEFDNFGNIKKKTISGVGLQPRITSYQYDPSGRFLTKSIDIESFATDYEYDFNNGLLKKEIKPGNIATAYDYDVWGKKKVITDYLGKKRDIEYSTSPTGFSYVTNTAEDNSYKLSEYDDLGRLVKETVKNIDDTYSAVNTQYDIYDRKVSESTPYEGLSGAPTSFNISSFDEYGRLVQTVEHTGKATTINYAGLTTTVSDGIKTEIITKDAVGNVVSKTDNGGSITYEYYVNGNLKKSSYNGTDITIEQDGWGRKKKLKDPSAGVYEYEYNILGELKKEITPNGTTEYFLNRFGKLDAKSIRGVNTNYDIMYYYDHPYGLLTMEDGTDNNLGFPFSLQYEYDNYNRLVHKYESNMQSFFEIDYEYDAFGRILTENYIANNAEGGQFSTKKIKNTYKNGYHWQIVDNVTNQVLWQTNTVNSRGQTTGASYGNGVNITNTYDQYGFPTQFKHEKTGTPSVNVMTLNTVFDPQRGNLTSRSNNLFNFNETFEYDNFDRLKEWGNSDLTLYNLNFDIGTGEFQTYSATTVNENGSLKISSATAYSGVAKTLENQASVGDKYTVSVKVDKGTTDKVRVLIVETDPVTGQWNQSFKGYAQNGVISFEHQVTQYPTVRLVVDKDGLSNDVGTTTNYYIDDLLVKKIVREKQDYDERGRITANNLGTYNYNKINSVTGIPILYQNSSITPTPAALAYYTAKPLQTVTYNVFKAPVKIEQPGIDIINFVYNAVNGRSSMFYGGLQSNMFARPLRKHYSADGLMEIKHNMQTGAVEFITYIGGDGYSAPVVLKSNGTTQEYLYLHRDYQGTIVAITNQAGNIIEKRHFDVWGAIVKVQDGAGNNLTGLTVLDRGYTGHEHLQSVGLIHMNGRLYDPKLHRFLQPDNNVQDPYNTQNFNRYGYVMNNPTKFTDPSGEYFGLDDAIAGVLGGLINLGVNIYQGNIHNFGQGLAAFGAGAAAGVLSLYGPAGWVAAGVILGGTNSWISGGDPIEGAIVGGVSGLIGGQLGQYASSLVGTFVINGIKITSPILQSSIVGSLTGGATGGFMSFGMALVYGKSFESALAMGLNGITMGLVTGGIAGAGSGYANAKANGINPVNGKQSQNPANRWPSNNGAVKGSEYDVELQPGTTFDRYGNEKGSYVAPEGTPFEQRSLPELYRDIQLNSYKVIKPIPNVEGSTIAPYFFQQGGGIQYKLPYSIEYLRTNGYIIKL